MPDIKQKFIALYKLLEKIINFHVILHILVGIYIK